MNKKNIFSAFENLPGTIFARIIKGFGKKTWDCAILGTILFFVVALLIFGISTWKPHQPMIQYTPADVVYENPIHVVHDVGFVSNPNKLDSDSLRSTESPEIVLSEVYYDFGVINSTRTLTHIFIIANSGKSSLVIQRAYTTCGCTVADITATEIPPGKVVLMTVQFDTSYHDMRGTTVRRGVVIETNDPLHPTQEIWIQASIR